MPGMSSPIQMQENCPFQLQRETSDKLFMKFLIKRHQRKREKGRGKKEEDPREQRAWAPGYWANGEQTQPPGLPSWCCLLGEAMRAAAPGSKLLPASRPLLNSSSFFHKKKRPVSVAQALYHMLLLVEKARQRKKKKKKSQSHRFFLTFF